MAIRSPARPDPTLHVLCVGSITLDHVYVVDGAVVPGQKCAARSHTDVGGGIAANAAVTVARLGGRATLVGCVGSDPTGELVLDELIDDGVDVSHVRRLEHGGTAESVVLTESSGERTIVGFSPLEILDEPVPELPIRDVDAVLVDTRWPAASIAALTLARDQGVPGIVDVDRSRGRDPGDDVLALATHLVFGADALEAASGTRDPELGLRSIAHFTSALVAVTSGSNGTHWIEDGALRHVEAFPVDVVDTTGAGDVFHGAYALAVAGGASTADAFRWASASAALKCSRPNARRGIPALAEVDHFLSDARSDIRIRQ